MTTKYVNDQIIPVPPESAMQDPKFPGRRVSPYQFAVELAGGYRTPGSEKFIHVNPDAEITIQAWAYMATFQGFDEWVRRIEERTMMEAIQRISGDPRFDMDAL